MRVVELIDTSVFAALIRVPNRDTEHEAVRREFESKIADGYTFVLPITTIIETGNLIANGSGDRRAAAVRLAEAIQMAREASPPWTVRDVAWDDDFLSEFLAGDSTGAPLVDHLSNGTLGGGDVAILVERDRLRHALSKGVSVRVWTVDGQLHAYGS